jgi:tetratricopeptide (TPR) repeat protein
MALADQDPIRALPVAEQAVGLAHEQQDPAAVAVAERAWGHALVHCGELDDAIHHFRRSARSGERAGSPALVAEARMKLAYAVMERGRPRAALQEIDAALPDLAGASAGRARAQRAIILHVSGRLGEALAEFEVALRHMRGAGDLLGVQRMLINRALVHTARHAFGSAARDLAEAETLAHQLGRQLTVGLVANNLGQMETFRGDIPAALAHLDRAEQIITAHGAQLGTLYQDRAELLLSAGLVSEARVAADQAVLAYQREDRLMKVPEVRLLLAQAAHLSGHYSAAVVETRKARRVFLRQGRVVWAQLARLGTLRAQLAFGARPRLGSEQLAGLVASLTAAGWPTAAADARIVSARLAQSRGDPQAKVLLRQASESATGRGTAVLRARGWYARALLSQSGGDHRGAQRAVRRGLRLLEEHAAAMAATDLRAHAAVHRTELVELGLRLATRDGRLDSVFEWSERARASHLLMRPVRPPNQPQLARLLSELRAATSEGATPARLAELERRIRDHGRSTRASGGQRAEGPVRLAQLRPALGDWALVEYVALDGQLSAITVVDGRARLSALGPARVVNELIDRLPFALHRLARAGSSAPGLRAATTLLAAASSRLDEVLLRPLAEVSDRPLVLVPTGVLHSLPWSALPSCRGRPVTVSPSATLWQAATCRSAPAADRVRVVAGPQLAGAVAEARAVADIYHVPVLAGSTAGVEAVLDALASSGVVHLAAHGRLSRDNPLFSDVMLADGPLMAYDLERLATVPHTVVLAACDSGRSVVHTGDELLGLAATFLSRGAAQLVASVVPVPDAETAPLMVAFHRRLATGEEPAVALSQAQLEIGDGGPRSLAASAGFVCIGSGRSAPIG